LKLVEWHTRSSESNYVDTWYDGRFIDLWADPEVVADLTKIFATYDMQSLQIAFVEVIDLINTLAAETSRRLDYHYPSQDQVRILAWLKDFSINKTNGRSRI